MNAPLADRLNVPARHPSGVVHRSYDCRSGENLTCVDSPHPWCYVQRSTVLLTKTTDDITCRRCLNGGSSWAFFVVAMEHPELKPVIERKLAS